MILNEYFQELFQLGSYGPCDFGPCVPDGLENNLIETPELLADHSVEDSINKIFENVPVSLGKQRFSPKLGSHKNLLPNELPKNGRPVTVWWMIHRDPLWKHSKLAAEILNDEKVQILEFQRDIFPQEQQDKLLG